MQPAGKQKLLQIMQVVPWLVVVLLGIAFVHLWHQNTSANDSAKAETVEGKWRPDEGKLKVYSDDDTTFTLWSRDEAIKFGFDNVVNSIVYLWVAASVLLGLIGRLMIDPLLDPTKGKLIQSSVVLNLVRHAAISALISIGFGFYAYLHFANVANDEEFSIYGALLRAVFCQIMLFLLAGGLLMLAINSVVTKHLRQGANSSVKTTD